MTAPTAPFGQLLGQAQIVSRALFDRILTTSGTTFEHWVTLKYLADRGGSARRTELIEAVSTGLRTTGAAARSALDALIEAGLITSDDESAGPPPGTPGRFRYEQISGRNTEQSARVFDGLAPDDLAAARRVLIQLAARGRTELAVAGNPNAGSRAARDPAGGQAIGTVTVVGTDSVAVSGRLRDESPTRT